MREMNIRTRIERLEKAAQRHTDPGCAIYDSDGNEVNGELIQIPEYGVDGIVRLQDGTAATLVYDVWVTKKLPGHWNETKSTEDQAARQNEGKLFWRQRPGSPEPIDVVIHFPPGWNKELL